MIRYGYAVANSLRTTEQLLGIKTVQRGEAQTRRQALAMIEDCPYRDAQGNSQLGIGTFWRSAEQQAGGGSNHAGLWESWHQGRSPSDDRDAVAIDFTDWTTGIPQGDGKAIRWANSVGHLYGLKFFRNVNNEPWHGQNVGVTTARSYMQPTPLKFPVWDLPGGDPIPPTPDPGPGVAGAPRATLRRGSSGSEVFDLINLLKFFRWYPAQHLDDTNDGKFGERAETGVKNMQSVFGITADGIYGPNTEQVLANFLVLMDDLNDGDGQPDPPAGIPPYYTVVTGDSWWRIARKKLSPAVDPTVLAVLNGATIDDIIRPGDRLAIPMKSAIVLPNDGWQRIANRLGVAKKDLQFVNGSATDKTMLHPGQFLFDPRG